MIAILKYNAGNALSVKNAVERLGYHCIVTDNKEQLLNAEKVIFPGVGEAKSAMYHLEQNGLAQLIPSLTQPVLGICLGLQLMCKSTEEGNTSGLKIFDTEVKKFPPFELVPHMGWNTVKLLKPMAISAQSYEGDYYFVHSYYAPICSDTIAFCKYGIPFSAVLQKDNFLATQFHPEKSSTAGEFFLKTFLES